MSLPVQFTKVPTGILEKACNDFKSSGNVLSVFLTIARNILQFPEGRKELKKELSLRYIGEQLNMKYQNVWKAVRRLVKKGYIRIVELGKDGIGSIIELVIPEETVVNTGKEEALIEAITPPENAVIKDITTSEKEVIKDITKNKNNISKNNTNKEPVLVCSSTENIIEDTIKSPINPIETKLQVKTSSITVKDCNDFIGPVDTQIKGISEKFFNMGIQALKERNITEINTAIEEIINEMSLRDKVKYPENYFLKLCREKNNWQNIIKKTAEDKETREEMKNRLKQETTDRKREEEERIAIIEENLQYDEIAEELKEKYPAEFRAAFKEVEMELRKKKIFDCLPSFIKNQYAIEVFRVMYPERI